ncbi:MAG TPA: hypothetical protein VGZ02_14940 [Candidatus Baltobacteraceae bacterium]|jgi:hypothetical protein|nr:hypothetical protein [Candidatus Baltobacteraceae bacterium]
MSAEVISAWAALGTLVVIGASAVAALIQLRHMRAGNQLEALLSLERDFGSPALQSALLYIQDALPARMEDPAYRAELEKIGYIDSAAHPELLVCNWCNEIGTLVKHRLVSQDAFMDLFARLIVYCWKKLSPAIAVMRRSRGDFQYHDFELLTVQAEDWLSRNPHGMIPRTARRIALEDPWRERDLQQTSILQR